MQVNFKHPPGSISRSNHVKLNSFVDFYDDVGNVVNIYDMVSSTINVAYSYFPNYKVSESDESSNLDVRPLRFDVRDPMPDHQRMDLSEEAARDFNTDCKVINRWLLSIGFEHGDTVFLEYED